MSEQQPISDQVVSSLRRITRAMDMHSRQLALQFGLTTPQLILLQELSRLEEVSVGGLAKNINLSHGTVTDILDRLEKRGFIQRSRSATDKRCVLVKATEMGLKLLDSAPPIIQEHFREEFTKLKDWEQSLILSSIQRLADLMQAPGFPVQPEPLPLTEAIQVQPPAFELIQPQQRKTNGE